MKSKDNKGFTLAELLIVVAIIAVLVAIAIPIFTAQLEKSREATDLANVRSGYAVVVVKYLDTNGGTGSIDISVHQRVDMWQTNGGLSNFQLTGLGTDGTESILVPWKTSGHWTIGINTSGTVTIS